MRIDSARASALIALFTALAVALPATASQDTGGANADAPPPLQDSGGLAGPAVKDDARSAQTPAPTPAQEDGPQIQDPPPADQETPDEETGPPAADEEPTTDGQENADAPATAAPSTGGGGGGSSGSDLPTTGLEIAALTAVGLGLLLAGVALRRRQTA